MQKKYELEGIFVGKVNEIENEFIEHYEYETSKSDIILVNNSDNYVNIQSLEYINNVNINSDLKIGSKFVFPEDLILFKDYLKNNGISVNQKSLTRDEILKLYEISKKQEVENTLAIIKPDGILHIEKIIEMFYQNGLKIKDFKVEQLSEEKIEEHYAHLLDKPFYPKLRNYMMSTPVALIVLEGINAVENLRNLMGPTDSTKASPTTIRGKFGSDITYNAIHGSDSKENAEIEINRFFKQKQKVK